MCVLKYTLLTDYRVWLSADILCLWTSLIGEASPGGILSANLKLKDKITEWRAISVWTIELVLAAVK